MRMHDLLVLALAFLAPALQPAAAEAASKEFWLASSTVEALGRDLSKVVPAVRDIRDGFGMRPRDYLKPMSCLGYYGPLGPYGPLGVAGPIGKEEWNPSLYAEKL